MGACMAVCTFKILQLPIILLTIACYCIAIHVDHSMLASQSRYTCTGIQYQPGSRYYCNITYMLYVAATVCTCTYSEQVVALLVAEPIYILSKTDRPRHPTHASHYSPFHWHSSVQVKILELRSHVQTLTIQLVWGVDIDYIHGMNGEGSFF